MATVHSVTEFSNEDLERLDAWLMRRGKGITDSVELEGFLTAIVIGPNTLSPLAWFPKVWGSKQPKFRDVDELNRFAGLVMGYYNDLVAWFEREPDGFKPTFYERKIDGRRVYIVDEWCSEFMKGLRLDSASWKPLKKQHPELLKPIELFGTYAGFRELEAGDADQMHKQWSPKITPAVRAIHAFWSPHRLARHQQMTAQALH